MTTVSGTYLLDEGEHLLTFATCWFDYYRKHNASSFLHYTYTDLRRDFYMQGITYFSTNVQVWFYNIYSDITIERFGVKYAIDTKNKISVGSSNFLHQIYKIFVSAAYICAQRERNCLHEWRTIFITQKCKAFFLESETLTQFRQGRKSSVRKTISII